MKLHNPFHFNKPSLFLMASVIISLIALFYAAVFVTFLLPGGIWLTLSLILIPTVGRTLYAIFKGE